MFEIPKEVSFLKRISDYIIRKMDKNETLEKRILNSKEKPAKKINAKSYINI